MQAWQKAVLVAAFLLLFASFPFWLYHDTRFFDYQPRWVQCAEDLGQGQLYTDLPRCGEPPVFYLTTWLLLSVTGDWFRPATRTLIIGLNLVLFLLLWQVTKKEKTPASWLLVLLYVPLI